MNVINSSTRRRWALLVIASAFLATAIMLASAWPVMGQDPPAEPPAKPTGLTGTVAHNQVTLTWDNPQDDSITSYQVLRRNKSIHERGEFIVHVDDTGSNATSYTDTDVEPEGRYTYRIKAQNANGLSSQSGYFDTQVPQPPEVTASFEQATHTVDEGQSVEIAVLLGTDPERTINIPIVATNQDDASDADYSGVPTEITFQSGETRQIITLTATDDAEDDDGESVKLAFGIMPHRVSAGSANETTVSITDNDEPEPVEPVDEDATRDGAVDLGDITNLDGARFPKYELDGAGDSVDYFSFTLTAPKQVTLGLRQLDKDADLSLEDRDSETLKRSQKEGTANEAIYQLVLEGTYFIRVEAQEAGENRYTLRYGVAEPTADEVAELRNQQDPGSGRDTARDLGDITAVAETTTVNQQVEKDTDDYDYYRFTLTEQKAVQITVTNQDADADLYIENSSGGSLGSSTNSGTEDEQKTVVLDAGTYYVIVEARSTGANDYTLGYQTSMPVEKTEDTSVQEPVRVPFALQTIDLITNTGQNDTGDRAVDSSDTGFASSFITGLNGTGYSFEGVQIRLGGFDTGDTVQVRIYDSAGSTAYPNIRKYTLTNPDTLPTSDDQVTEFTAPADATLDPDAVYWVTVERTGGSFTIARTNSDDEIGETDWTIGDSSRQRAGAQHWSSASNSDRHLMFTVRGEGNTVDPEQTILASNATTRQATGARLINNSILRRATSFTTGDNSVGYTLGQIDVPLNGISTGDAVYLKIYNDTSGAPDTLKHTFTAPNPFPAGTMVKVTFTAPTDATLNANTTYWMAIERNTGALEVSNTTSNEERGLSDWSIGNTEIQSTANNWDTITSFSQALRFTVWGRVNDEDTTGPSLQADNSHVNPAGTQVILQFDEDIDETTANLPPPTAFTVEADGTSVSLSSLEVSSSGERRPDYSQHLIPG